MRRHAMRAQPWAMCLPYTWLLASLLLPATVMATHAYYVYDTSGSKRQTAFEAMAITQVRRRAAADSRGQR